MNKPSAQTKLSFGEEGQLGIKIPEEIKPVFSIGDKVRFNPEYPHMKGVFEVDDIFLTWGEPLYVVFNREGKGTLFSCCAAKALIKVE